MRYVNQRNFATVKDYLEFAEAAKKEAETDKDKYASVAAFNSGVAPLPKEAA